MQVANEITKLKEKYNHFLKRNKEAEEYFKTHTVNECINQKFKGGTPLDGFNEVARNLSNLMMQIKAAIGREMTQDEILNGFN